MVENARLEKTKEIIDDASGLIDKLYAQVADDGMITRDELGLVKVISDNISDYQDLLQKVIKDGKVSDEDIKQMKAFEQNLMDAMKTEALADGKVTVPEKEIIDSLTDHLHKLDELENLQ